MFAANPVHLVYSVRYITERCAGKSRPSQRPCAFVSFNLRYLPGFIRVYAKDYEILVPNPMQCTRCCRYGHQGKQCRAEIRCPICGKPHAKQYCNSQIFRCVNCKGGHPSTSHECLVWQQGKLMNELRYRGGLTAEEAIDVASNGTIQHKKHSFIAPTNEYFENLESFYLGSGSGDGSGEEIDVNSGVDSSANPMVNVSDDPHNNDCHYNEENVVFHPRFIAGQEFLDIMTDFFLKLANPTKNYTSAMLMPGFEEDSVVHRLNTCRLKKPSRVAQQFKISVLQSLEEDERKKLGEMEHD
ncbi:Nucleic-acid-binding protein from mobile element jockey [Folsomia candida]|uniref:Nucleic-acid-binding protein from mobile element jockey n=1 Tax=Folsomia candida TaxID=158441 RepID=A0A226ET68_FOLCA|nr:Nucleic-acid-binding protein from mobile element jockey [Folsomia candida]